MSITQTAPSCVPLRHSPQLKGPDIVIWSAALKKVVMIELTCPAEEGIEAARERKLGRYFQLKQDIANAGWVADLLTIEVGAGGYVAYSVERCFSCVCRSGR